VTVGQGMYALFSKVYVLKYTGREEKKNKTRNIHSSGTCLTIQQTRL